MEKEDKVDKVDGDLKLDACNCTKVKKLASKWVKEKKSNICTEPQYLE